MTLLRVTRGWLVALGSLAACAGCGYKGPLYLPERNAAVVTHPAPTAPAAGQRQPPDAKKKGAASTESQPPGASPPPPR